MSNYMSLVTDSGASAMSNATVNGTKINITHMAVGDAGGTLYVPTGDMSALVNERWRGSVSDYSVDADSPNVIKISGVVPASVGGFTVREIGLFDENGTLIAVANTPELPKIAAGDGAIYEMLITMDIAVVNTEVVTIMVDPAVSLATKRELDEKITQITVTIGALESQISTKLDAKADLVDGKIPESQLPILGGYVVQSGAPTNKKLLWIDGSGILKYNNGTSWVNLRSVWG